MAFCWKPATIVDGRLKNQLRAKSIEIAAALI
jgi:hypothetical protein